METLLEKLVAALAADLPAACYDLDAAESPAGASWIDFKGGPLAGVSVEVRPSQGYGVHGAGSEAAFSGPDKVRTTAREVVDDLKALYVRGPAPA